MGWIAQLQAEKTAAREVDAVPLLPAVRSWLDGWLERSSAVAKALPSRRAPVEPLDRLLVDVLRG